MNNNWAKTLLTVYRYLGRVTKSFDRLVNSTANNSMCVSIDGFSYTNVWNVTSRILELTERKITLINLKVIIEKVLKSMDRESARILIMKFIDGKTSEETSKHFGICSRTYFRKCNIALDSFTKALNRLGYDSDNLCKMLQSEKWIISVFDKLEGQCLQKSEDRQEDILNTWVKNNIYFEFKRIKCCY